jgi:type IV secretory pathway TrbL component
MTTAEHRARTAIARQLQTKVQAMFTDYNLDAGNVNAQANASLQEDVSRQITDMDVSGARPIKRWEAPDGTWWFLVEFKKSDAKSTVASILRNEEAAFAQFKAQQALDMLDYQLGKSERGYQVDN